MKVIFSQAKNEKKVQNQIETTTLICFERNSKIKYQEFSS